MPVAKSYLNLEQVSSFYLKDDKFYVKVRTKSGAIKEVRWLTNEEFEKKYPGVPYTPWYPDRKHIFGFLKGYVYIFGGDTNSEVAQDWFKRTVECWRNVFFDWFVPSRYDTFPSGMPDCIYPVRLYWEDVSDEKGRFKLETEAEAKKLMKQIVKEREAWEFY